MSIPVEEMYKQRKDFVIVALTGITGSGCSDLAYIMASPFDAWKDSLRSTEKVAELRGGSKGDMVFQREYDLCYHVCEKQYQPFEVIKYRNVLLLSTLEVLASKCGNPASMRDAMADLVKQKFDKSHEIPEDVDDKQYVVDNNITAEQLIGFGMDDDLCKWVLEVAGIDKQQNKRNYRRHLYELYRDQKFQGFCESFYDELKRRDYYAKNFFVSRLATSLRGTGDPRERISSTDYKSNDYIFTVADKINCLIKGYHEVYPDKPRRFVIDSVRNSMEILYLRERYNAFYMIAMHNDNNEVSMIRQKVSKSMFGEDWEYLNEDAQAAVSIKTTKMMNLSSVECGMEDFEDGRFYGPDISRCVTESEIHIAHHQLSEISDGTLENVPRFYTTAEQWMKFYALIIRPGLITPSRDERCMSVAYVAKFNSGCISRQVGCTIVDQNASILSVGWNDPPSKQLPCQLRYADELCHCGEEGYKYVKETETRLFSTFELYGMVKPTDKTKQPREFVSHMKEDIKEDTIAALQEQGLRYPYCFRSRYNSFKGPKDQVNTRSLHAEENTMLRIAKSGGHGLDGGIMYVTASPCVLCSKKAFQIGITEIVYLDPYTDIAPELILSCGYDQPKLRPFMGAIGETFYKLYKPFMPYKDELTIWEKTVSE